ncbi:YkvA family protein [Hoylesella saccharolytica]|uniref:YkvA family protein n=1 Tax=Hoylesella saccharolytica TaxID=633701 RepID=UPI0028EA02D4|nr:YkvA family protein [Hoylesella saccharolytica]
MEKTKTDLPDFMSYKDKFTQNGFIDKVSRIAKRAGAKLVYAALILYYTLQSDKVSVKDKTLIIGALGYLISPLDVMPDAIPIVGLGDDLSVLIYVLHKVWGDVSIEIKEKAHEKLSKWFDEEEIKEADELLS